jgi:uncharacterized protein YndB with AHSA1/START domain
MPDRTITHADFTLERVFSASPAQVYAAFADAETKRAWFVAADAGEHVQHELDFRIGGLETSRGRRADGSVHTLKAVYYDMIPNERIVYAYEMYREQTRISVSLATVEFLPEDDGTHLILTETGVFLDGRDKPKWRAEGINKQLDALEEVLDRKLWIAK